MLAGDLGTAVRKARERQPARQIEIECRDLDEVQAALDAGADRLLLDNMSPEDLRAAVTAVEQASDGGDRPALEASGGITLDNVPEVAASGVDYISVGALTHSAPALDLSMEIEPA
jgi:nicotinate-nucleotide pyrophosphorylase (carboxylating)